MKTIANRRNQDHDNDDSESLSRSDYRKQQQDQQAAFAKRDRERLRAEQRYAKDHPEVTQKAAQVSQEVAEHKRRRLGRKLNWAIFWLSIGIIAVFLVLFFVEF